MEKLAIHGGTPVRTQPFPKWPIWGREEEEALLATLRSGQWGIGGDRVSQFEAAFARFQDAKYGVCVTNGTAALEIALRAVGIRPGDEVIIPPYTFVATATACLALGALPVFADIDPETYNLSADAAESQIRAHTRAIIGVHIAGCPADMDALPELAQRHGLALIEDGAQAHAAAWRGRRVGAIGDLGTFSFQSSKNLNAGEGGIILSNNEELAERCWSIHNVGRVRQGAWYQHETWGSNFRMTQWQAAILLAQMTRLAEQSARREENAAYLSQELSKLGLRPLRRDPRVTQHAWHIYIFRYDPSLARGATREQFIQAMNAEGIPCASGYVPLYATNAVRAGVADTLRWVGRDPAEIDRLLRPCPAAERACYQEAVWFSQTMLLGSRADMDSIVEAAAKVLRLLEP